MHKQEFADLNWNLMSWLIALRTQEFKFVRRSDPHYWPGYDLRAGRVNGPQVEMQRNHKKGPDNRLIMAKRWEQAGFRQRKKFRMDIITYITRDGTNCASWPKAEDTNMGKWESSGRPR